MFRAVRHFQALRYASEYGGTWSGAREQLWPL